MPEVIASLFVHRSHWLLLIWRQIIHLELKSSRPPSQSGRSIVKGPRKPRTSQGIHHHRRRIDQHCVRHSRGKKGGISPSLSILHQLLLLHSSFFCALIDTTAVHNPAILFAAKPRKVDVAEQFPTFHPSQPPRPFFNNLLPSTVTAGTTKPTESQQSYPNQALRYTNKLPTADCEFN